MSGRGRGSSRRCRSNCATGSGTINIEVQEVDVTGGDGETSSVILEPSSASDGNQTDDDTCPPSQSQLWKETNPMLNPVVSFIQDKLGCIKVK